MLTDIERAAEKALLLVDDGLGHEQACDVYRGSSICCCAFHKFYEAYLDWKKLVSK